MQLKISFISDPIEKAQVVILSLKLQKESHTSFYVNNNKSKQVSV